ncbi:sirohydrochlorin chelatase [Brevibacterium oceani]|uniref:sirohydrochlorin chelatase n=1 Tax=Brevibacterium oceani TaxID=358099 RepID=UPI002811DF79|nr:CbiX/SirB N-terminal domain-containing protein [Brevibacterium oceani]
MRGGASSGLPSLGLISHGTSSSVGQSLIEALAAAVARDLRERGLVDEVMLGHVDVQQPDVDEVIDRLPHDRPVVLVPLLLSPGYHVHVDLSAAVVRAQKADRADDANPAEAAARADDANPAEAAARADDANPAEAAARADDTNPAEAAARAGDTARDIRLTPTLGPDPRLARVLAERLPTLRADDEIVLAAAGSSDERANESCREMGELLAQELGRPVSVGFLAGAGTPLKGFIEQNASAVNRLVLANYLLAPGFFDDLARGLISDTQNVLSSPLLTSGEHQRLPESDPQSAAEAAEFQRPTIPELLVDIVRDRFLNS